MVSSCSFGERTIARSSERKPFGTVTTATTRPDSSCRSASSFGSRTSVTSRATRSIVRSTWNVSPAISTSSGSPSRSTNATRGFAFANCATSTTSAAISSG